VKARVPNSYRDKSARACLVCACRQASSASEITAIGSALVIQQRKADRERLAAIPGSGVPGASAFDSHYQARSPKHAALPDYRGRLLPEAGVRTPTPA